MGLRSGKHRDRKNDEDPKVPGSAVFAISLTSKCHHLLRLLGPRQCMIAGFPRKDAGVRKTMGIRFV
jgi:hypothetical protein